MFSTPHVSGALFEALGFFKESGLNLAKIESRPIPDKLGEYLFFVDLEGNVGKMDVSATLDKLKAYAPSYRFLGNYKRLG